MLNFHHVAGFPRLHLVFTNINRIWRMIDILSKNFKFCQVKWTILTTNTFLLAISCYTSIMSHGCTQIFLIFIHILALRVGDSPTRKGPGYATALGYNSGLPFPGMWTFSQSHGNSCKYAVKIYLWIWFIFNHHPVPARHVAWVVHAASFPSRANWYTKVIMGCCLTST